MSKPGEKRAKKTQKTLFETFKKPRISTGENSVVDDSKTKNSVRVTFVESTDQSSVSADNPGTVTMSSTASNSVPSSNAPLSAQEVSTRYWGSNCVDHRSLNSINSMRKKLCAIGTIKKIGESTKERGRSTISVHLPRKLVNPSISTNSRWKSETPHLRVNLMWMMS